MKTTINPSSKMHPNAASKVQNIDASLVLLYGIYIYVCVFCLYFLDIFINTYHVWRSTMINAYVHSIESGIQLSLMFCRHQERSSSAMGGSSDVQALWPWNFGWHKMLTDCTDVTRWPYVFHCLSPGESHGSPVTWGTGGLPGTCAAGRDSTSPSCAKCLPGLHGTEDVCLPCVGGDYVPWKSDGETRDDHTESCGTKCGTMWNSVQIFQKKLWNRIKSFHDHHGFLICRHRFAVLQLFPNSFGFVELFGSKALIAVVCVLCVMGIAILYIVLVHESQKSRLLLSKLETTVTTTERDRDVSSSSWNLPRQGSLGVC